MTHPITTYRVTDARACALTLPMGRLIRHLCLHSQFQGRPDGDNPEWVERANGGFVKVSLLEPMETSIGVRSNRRAVRKAQDAPLVRRHPQFTTWQGTYDLIGPDGAAYHVRNLARFCRREGLSAKRLYDVVGGWLGSYHGWRVERVK